MTKKKTDYSWISIPPAKEIISTLANGAEFLDIGVVEGLLYKLDSHWGTENFRFRVFEFLGVPFVSASLELVVTYGRRTRRLVGAFTEPVPPETNPYDPYTNVNYEATLKSECTKNAVKPIGLAFGQGLNDRTVINQPLNKGPKNAREKPAAVILPPDVRMQDQYNQACEKTDQALMQSIRAIYPEIKYTGIKTLYNAENRMGQ